MEARDQRNAQVAVYRDEERLLQAAQTLRPVLGGLPHQCGQVYLEFDEASSNGVLVAFEVGFANLSRFNGNLVKLLRAHLRNAFFFIASHNMINYPRANEVERCPSKDFAN